MRDKSSARLDGCRFSQTHPSHLPKYRPGARRRCGGVSAPTRSGKSFGAGSVPEPRLPNTGAVVVGRTKDVLTTGEVARLCNVAPRTVSKWFDSGQLRGYRIPGSKDRRIPIEQLIRFMKRHGMPLNGLETHRIRVLIVDDEPDLTDLLQRTLSERTDYQVFTAGSGFEAGALLEQYHPSVVLIDVDLPGVDPRLISRYLASNHELEGIQLIAMSASLTESDRQRLFQEGFHNAIAKPFSIADVTQVIEETMALVS